MYELTKAFQLDDSFISRYEKLIVEKVIPYQEDILHDRLEGVEKSNAIANFILAGEVIQSGLTDKTFYGMVFQDSDVAKWLEAAANSLIKYPDSALEERCDTLIDIIENAQESDGYLNTYFTIKSPDKKWDNLLEAHELYCAGHMMEAAVAYASSTSKRKLLNIMSKMTDHIYDRFITQETPGFPGHPEIELALMKMYHFTRKNKYKELAQHFIYARGKEVDFYQKEAQKRDWTVWNADSKDGKYTQSDMPVVDQKDAVGHAVRAVYLYTGMADLANTINDEPLKVACKRLWQSITTKRMYVTGGIGSVYEGEAFTSDYHLPNDTAYSETCASIGLMFFAKKMLEMEKNSTYADVMERALYNTVLAGMQLDGTKFFYVNPLEVIPSISGISPAHKHALAERPQWFACACCPPNVARVLTSLAEYTWEIVDTILYSHLFIGGELTLPGGLGGKVRLDTHYPHQNVLNYSFEPTEKDKPMEMTLAIRVPNYSDKTQFELNGRIITPTITNGYAYIKGPFTKESQLVVTLDMTIKRIYANSKVANLGKKVAISRGPLIYCIEGVDNNHDILGLRLKDDSQFIAQYEDHSYGITSITTDGIKVNSSEALYAYSPPTYTPCKIKLIPYYAWCNRGLNEMRVWIPEL